MASTLHVFPVEILLSGGQRAMQTAYWENLQPFVEVEPSDTPVDLDRLRALFLALQGALCEARRLGEQVAAEYAHISSNGTSSRNQSESSVPPSQA